MVKYQTDQKDVKRKFQLDREAFVLKPRNLFYNPLRALS